MARQQVNVSEADIAVAIGKLAKLGGGFRTIQVGSSTMVVSVPTELDNDHMSVLTVAQSASGTGNSSGITVDQVMASTGWTRARTERALELLLSEGMAWIDDYQGVTYYWFTSLWQEQQDATAAAAAGK
jgi:ESCRT-II complex subunit VPS22